MHCYQDFPCSSLRLACRSHAAATASLTYIPHVSLPMQGGETKRMFRALNLQPGDGLKLEPSGKQSGVPTTRLTVIPAGTPASAAAPAAALHRPH